VNKEHLITFSVFVKVGHASVNGRTNGYGAITVREQYFSGLKKIFSGRGNMGCVEVNVPQRLIAQQRWSKWCGFTNTFYPGGRVVMVQDRVDAGEALRAYYFFVKEVAIRASELYVPLGWYVAKVFVIHKLGSGVYPNVSNNQGIRNPTKGTSVIVCLIK
jgi:hypothetical protein